MKLVPGQKAPLFVTKDIFGNTVDLNQIQNEKILLSFFRYAECAMCNLQIAKIMKSKDLFAKKGIQLITVFESPTESLQSSIAYRHQFDFPVIADTNRDLYDLYKVHPSWFKTMRTLSAKGFQHLAEATKKGYKAGGKVEGTLHQIPADFLIGKDKVIQIAHYGNSVIDHFPLEKVFQMS
ncbi:peroxiredoxin-like family protein [Flavobacterium flavipallidum]|uniref:Peroxiredoxin-like family protein n=1 Tax=Flavobacterium flavipallidum TaxID=3139140 RepID=A0ABU9HKC8_9FLAO